MMVHVARIHITDSIDSQECKIHTSEAGYPKCFHVKVTTKYSKCQWLCVVCISDNDHCYAALSWSKLWFCFISRGDLQSAVLNSYTSGDLGISPVRISFSRTQKQEVNISAPTQTCVITASLFTHSAVYWQRCSFLSSITNRGNSLCKVWRDRLPLGRGLAWSAEFLHKLLSLFILPQQLPQLGAARTRSHQLLACGWYVASICVWCSNERYF